MRKRRTWEAGTGLRLGWGQSQKDGRTASRTSPDKGTKTCLCVAEREQRRGRQGHHAQVCSCEYKCVYVCVCVRVKYIPNSLLPSLEQDLAFV